MLEMFLSYTTSSGSTGGTSLIFIIVYILIFGLLFLALPIGFIFLIYFLVKKLIDYYKK